MQIVRSMKEYNQFKITAKWTLGKIEAVKKALELYSPQSPVAGDVLNELKYEYEEKGLANIRL